MNISKTEKLLKEVNTLLKIQEEKKILRGESFNIFSILKVETKENNTHSAFIKELLNPNGSHLQGNLFLKLFLQVIEDSTIDIKTAQVKTEHNIGNINQEKNEGGRIDIYIWDKKDNTISIENKIYADDQENQVLRYCNYNKQKNSVYYLNLYGYLPSDKSTGNSMLEDDFKIISYKNHILNWLEQCAKESYNIPVLREAINQYIILIKKLTHKMDNKEEKKILDLIIDNKKEVETLISNYETVFKHLPNKIRDSVSEIIKKKKIDYISLDDTKKNNRFHSYKIFNLNDYKIQNIKFCLQIHSFYKEHAVADHDCIYIGILEVNGKAEETPDIYKDLGTISSPWWIGIEEIKELEGIKPSLRNPKTLKKLSSDQVFYDKFVEHIATQTVEYIKKNHTKVVDFLNKTHN